jgi:CRP/FNR family transcriptional regulator, cyclic AMP receptor protein
VIVMQNINRELCRRLRRADGRIAELIARDLPLPISST